MKTIKILPIIAATLLLSKVSLAQNDGVLIDPSETLTRHPSATLEVGPLQSTTANDYGGFLAPRMTLANRGNIASPAAGLLIYQTDNTPGYYLYNGSGWNRLFEGTGSTSITLNGNSFERAALTGDVTAAANSNATTIADNAVDGTDIDLSGNTNGDMMYYNGTDWVRLASSTSGRILRTNGAAAPSWSDLTGIMTVENGLTETAPGTIRLGGALTQATTITQGSYNMEFNLNGTGDMRVMDGTTERVRFEDGGRVEILGTTDASGTAGTGVLEIGNSLRLDGNEMITNTDAILYINNDNNGDVRMDGSTLVVDASANRVGVGTASPEVPLHVNISNSATTARFGDAQPVYFVANSPMVGFNVKWFSGYKYGTNGYGGMLNFNQESAGGFTFLTAPSGTADAVASMSTRLIIQNNGIVDIRKGVLFNCDDCGSNSTLDGNANWGDLTIQGRVLSTNSNLHLSPPSGFGVYINTAYRAAGGSTGTTSGLWVDDQTKMMFTTTGQFAGASGFTFGGQGVLIENASSESGGFQANGNNANIWSPGDADLVRFYDEDGMVLKTVFNGNGTYSNPSDRNKKQNIKKVENALDKVLTLNGYNYEFKLHPEEIEKGQKPSLTSGVIAQEVQEVMPELVSEIDGQGLFMNYDGLFPYLIEAIKELKATIDLQQQEIEKLKMR